MTYSVHVLGPAARVPNMDALHIRLRVGVDGDYFQFFRALAPGPTLAALQPAPGSDFWRVFAQMACDDIERAVRDGLTPLNDPMTAIDLYPDIEHAHRISRSDQAIGVPVPREDQLMGVIVRVFQVG